MDGIFLPQMIVAQYQIKNHAPTAHSSSPPTDELGMTVYVSTSVGGAEVASFTTAVPSEGSTVATGPTLSMQDCFRAPNTQTSKPTPETQASSTG